MMMSQMWMIFWCFVEEYGLSYSSAFLTRVKK